MIRLMAIVSFVGCRLDPRCKERPSLRALWRELREPGKEPFS